MKQSGGWEKTVLRLLFDCATHHPEWLPLLRPIVKHGVALLSQPVTCAIAANSRRLFGDPEKIDPADVVAAFYDFITDLALGAAATPTDFRARVTSVDGHDDFVALRKRGNGCGAVMVTAHMGSFEVGLAALAEVEKEIHVVFKRDEFDQFESLRRRTREMLGVHEAAIDDGWPTLIHLRDRLNAGAVVVMQGDRAMPGQKSQILPFARGHLRLPLGPLRLAQITGSPIVPVFTIRQPNGKFHVALKPPIDPAAENAMEQLAAVLAHTITQHADQWLVLQPAFVEDAQS